jgi:hypothetical protein
MDRFVPRDDGKIPRDDRQITVTARRLATRQSMDRFVPRDDEKIPGDDKKERDDHSSAIAGETWHLQRHFQGPGAGPG